MESKKTRRSYRFSFDPTQQNDVIDALDRCSRPLRNEMVAAGIRMLTKSIKNGTAVPPAGEANVTENPKKTITDIFTKAL